MAKTYAPEPGGSWKAVETPRGAAEALEASGNWPFEGVLCLLPPLWDHHGHVSWLGALLEQADLRGCRSADEACARAAALDDALPPGVWLEGFGWDQNLWEGRFPHRDLLDRRVPLRPVLLHRIDGHTAWANGAALAEASIGPGTPDPPGGRILKDGGLPTGILMDTAVELVASRIPPPDESTLRRRLLAALGHLRAMGLCGATDMNLEPSALEALRTLDAGGPLPASMDGYFWQKPGQPVTGRPWVGRMARASGAKYFADGALGSRGAALAAPYDDAPGEMGLVLWDAGAMATSLASASAGGLTPAIHAIGDRALDLVLDALEASGTGPCSRIEHVQLATDAQVARMAALGVTASIQPCHFLSDRAWAPERLGARMNGAYRCGSLAAAGIPLLLGTDFPIEVPRPARNLFAAVAGERPHERIGLGAALAASAPPAWAMRPGAMTLALCQAPPHGAGERWLEEAHLVAVPGDLP